MGDDDEQQTAEQNGGSGDWSMVHVFDCATQEGKEEERARSKGWTEGVRYSLIAEEVEEQGGDDACGPGEESRPAALKAEHREADRCQQEAVRRGAAGKRDTRASKSQRHMRAAIKEVKRKQHEDDHRESVEGGDGPVQHLSIGELTDDVGDRQEEQETVVSGIGEELSGKDEEHGQEQQIAEQDEKAQREMAGETELRREEQMLEEELVLGLLIGQAGDQPGDEAVELLLMEQEAESCVVVIKQRNGDCVAGKDGIADNDGQQECGDEKRMGQSAG